MTDDKVTTNLGYVMLYDCCKLSYYTILFFSGNSTIFSIWYIFHNGEKYSVQEFNYSFPWDQKNKIQLKVISG